LGVLRKIALLIGLTAMVNTVFSQNSEFLPYRCGRVFRDVAAIRNDAKAGAYLENVEFRKGWVVADIGTENGYLPVAVSLFTDSIAFYLEDISPVCLNQKEFSKAYDYYASLSGGKIRSSFTMTIGWQNDTRLPAHFFDVVMMNDVIHQLFYPDSFLSNLRNILKDDGKLYLGQFENNGITENEIVFLLKKNGFQLTGSFKKLNFLLFEFVKAEPQTKITSVHEAAICGDSLIFRRLYKRSDEINAAGLTPLHYAAKYGRIEIARFLIEQGADVNAIGKIYPISPLMLAVRCNQSETAILLIQKGADVNRVFEGKSILMTAAANGNTDMVNVLINHHTDTKYKFEGISYQFFAAESGSVPLMNYLLKIKEINKKMTDVDKKTLLFYAVRSGSLPMVKFLVEKVRVDPLSRDVDGKTAIDEAYDMEIIAYLSHFKKS